MVDGQGAKSSAWGFHWAQENGSRVPLVRLRDAVVLVSEQAGMVHADALVGLAELLDGSPPAALYLLAGVDAYAARVQGDTVLCPARPAVPPVPATVDNRTRLIAAIKAHRSAPLGSPGAVRVVDLSGSADRVQDLRPESGHSGRPAVAEVRGVHNAVDALRSLPVAPRWFDHLDDPNRWFARLALRRDDVARLIQDEQQRMAGAVPAARASMLSVGLPSAPAACDAGNESRPAAHAYIADPSVGDGGSIAPELVTVAELVRDRASRGEADAWGPIADGLRVEAAGALRVLRNGASDPITEADEWRAWQRAPRRNVGPSGTLPPRQPDTPRLAGALGALELMQQAWRSSPPAAGRDDVPPGFVFAVSSADARRLFGYGLAPAEPLAYIAWPELLERFAEQQRLPRLHAASRLLGGIRDERLPLYLGDRIEGYSLVTASTIIDEPGTWIATNLNAPPGSQDIGLRRLRGPTALQRWMRENVGREFVELFQSLAISEADASAVFGIGNPHIDEATTSVVRLVSSRAGDGMSAGGRLPSAPAEHQARAPATESTFEVVQPAAGCWPHKHGAPWNNGERDAMFEMRHRLGLTDDGIATRVGLKDGQRISQVIGAKHAWKRVDWPGIQGWKPSAELLGRCGLQMTTKFHRAAR